MSCIIVVVIAVIIIIIIVLLHKQITDSVTIKNMLFSETTIFCGPVASVNFFQKLLLRHFRNKEIKSALLNCRLAHSLVAIFLTVSKATVAAKNVKKIIEDHLFGVNFNFTAIPQIMEEEFVEEAGIVTNPLLYDWELLVTVSLRRNKTVQSLDHRIRGVNVGSRGKENVN